MIYPTELTKSVHNWFNGQTYFLFTKYGCASLLPCQLCTSLKLEKNTVEFLVLIHIGLISSVSFALSGHAVNHVCAWLGEVRSIFSSSTITYLCFSRLLVPSFFTFFFRLSFSFCPFPRHCCIHDSIKATIKLHSTLLSLKFCWYRELSFTHTYMKSRSIRYKIFTMISLIPLHPGQSLDCLLPHHFVFPVGSQPESLGPAHQV